MTLLDKMRLYDGRIVGAYTLQDVIEMKRHHTGEGMSGISPRYVMNRIAIVAGIPDIKCVTPLAVLNSLWQGIDENVSLDQAARAESISLITDTVSEYNDLAVSAVQRAYVDSFEDTAANLLAGYLKNVRAFCSDDDDFEEQRDMQEIERAVNIREKDKKAFREEIDRLASQFRKHGSRFDYTTEPRLKAAIESRLFPSNRELHSALSRPRFALQRAELQRAEWSQRRISIIKRLTEKWGYCAVCAEDLLEYVTQLLQKKTMFKTPKNESVEWQWELYPTSETILAPSEEGSKSSSEP
jgi:serine protein kinase